MWPVEQAERKITKEKLRRNDHLQIAAQLFEAFSDSENYSICLARLARVYELQGRYTEAEPLYVEALEIRKTELGDRHPYTAYQSE